MAIFNSFLYVYQRVKSWEAETAEIGDTTGHGFSPRPARFMVPLGLLFSLALSLGCWLPGLAMVYVIELDDGKIYRKALYLMVKTMVSCRFSLKPIH